MTADLIARLKAAPEGSRELSDQILRAVGWETKTTDDGVYWRHGDSSWTRDDPDRPHPSCSIDDGQVHVLPEGWDWTLDSQGGCEVYRDVPPGSLPGDPSSKYVDADAATPELAFCIASLRARAEHP